MMISAVGNYAHALDVQAHRGGKGLFPENTLPAFTAAIEAGAGTLELDLQVTLDGEVVIHHDYFVDDAAWISSGPSSGSLIRFLKLSEIKKIDCGSKIDPDFPRQKRIPGIQIPTLDELFALIDDSTHPNAKSVRLNLEIKRDARHPEFFLSAEELAIKVVSKVGEKGFSQRVYYSSFDPEVLMKIYQLEPTAELGFIFDTESLETAQILLPDNLMGLVVKLAKSFNAKVLSPDMDLLTDAGLVHFLHQSGFQVIPWTVNSPEQWAKFIEMGVDGIITDYPQDLLLFLKEKGR
ncbi:MAG TPA: glycerophosphodiester phosphodiesterase family protein [Rhabdochlamydiaceae bacterium]|nr:glycerophosphodiester phosphodiesterase family protein [Rhabdochlamydiaceae bacterium]